MITKKLSSGDQRARLLREQFNNVDIIECNITQESECATALDQISDLNGPVQAMINLSCYRPTKSYLEDSVDVWRDSIELNSLAIYVPSKLFANHMARNKGGAIINFSSIYAHVAPDPWLYEGTDMGTEPDYPFLKGGCISFSRYMAGAYASAGVRFNTISLGGLYHNQPKTFVERYSAKTLVGRMVEEHDIAGPTLFLCSDCSRYITGQDLLVDGGFTVR